MAEFTLTIAIPTYNRPSQLAHTLERVLPQVLPREDVELLLLDNHSEVSAENILSDVALKLQRRETLPSRVMVNRHPANIGGVANILHCFEKARGEWLWVLSDDDEPAEDAVETILNDSVGEHCYAYYGLKPGVPDVADSNDGKYLGSSIKEWVRRIPSYGFRLFISESVFRVEAMRPYMSLAYIVASSGAPHLVMAYCAVAAGGQYLLSSKQIAVFNAPAGTWGYNFARLAYGTTLLRLVAAKGSYADYDLFFRRSYQNWISPTVIFRHMVAIHPNMPAASLRRTYSVIAAVFKPSLFERPLQWVKWNICGILSFVPSFGNLFFALRIR